jgi:NAD(P)-dependent dehydrogenase (short-subunit alcohol dehydrogenase family)
VTPHKVAIITGASRGIGAGLVTGYRKRGWAVVASGRTIRPSRDPDLLALAADTTDPIAATGIVDAALERFGRLDTLVNNSGVVIAKPFTDYTATDFVTVVGTSLSGFFWLTQRAIGEMAMRYGGHVVTVSATPPHAADPGAPALLAALAAGGLAAATRALAVEYAARGIRVNAVSTRAIRAPLYAADGYHDPGSRFPPLGRTGQASDIVDGVLFLEFSPYITGEILHIDGGQGAQGEQL